MVFNGRPTTLLGSEHVSFLLSLLSLSLPKLDRQIWRLGGLPFSFSWETAPRWVITLVMCCMPVPMDCFRCIRPKGVLPTWRVANYAIRIPTQLSTEYLLLFWFPSENTYFWADPYSNNAYFPSRLTFRQCVLSDPTRPALTTQFKIRFGQKVGLNSFSGRIGPFLDQLSYFSYDFLGQAV